MKVCMLTSSHPPLDDRVFYREAKSLVGMGYDVAVIAPSDGEVKHAFWRGGVQVVPVRPLRRGWVHRLGIIWDLFRKGFASRAHVYHCHEPESLWIGALLKVLRGVRVIYDVHEHWPSSRSERLPLPLRKLGYFTTDIAERLAARCTGYVLVVCGPLRRRFRNRPLEVIYNVPPWWFYASLKRPSRSGKVIVYSGGITWDRGIRVLLEALLEVRSRVPDVRLKMVGRYKEPGVQKWVEEFVRKHGLERCVEYTGWLPYDKVPIQLAEADVGVALLQPIRYNYRISLPNKLFEYMAAGIPVVISDFSEIGKVVRETGCGIPVDPTDPGAVVHAIVRLLSHPEEARRMGERGRKAVEEQYCWERMEERLARVYDSVAL
ncbi:MAG: glycosyltransferase WbuB [Candidatus Latescibacterota bacterium]|nr:MAG: glycosyltransferase WbuB [Candidatus Latescibacterota bacterium]RKY73671.1 MAG: glycosyltransferase WbuB [Candidatus Latescibacterota bacterium]HDH99687.1 glycosyltransferase WbuB [Bacillota bacterium]